MRKPALQMKARKESAQARSWFRIENAHVDSENSTDDTTKVYIYDEIGDSWWGESTASSDFIKQLANIDTANIELHLNSPGGDIFDGVAIYNALKAHSAKVTVIVDALAASAASFIAQAGDEVIMTKAATMMIHDGSSFAWGNAADLRSTADLLDKLSNTIAEIYSDRAGNSIEFWRALMVEETWYNSHEAVEAGLADRIGEETKEEDDNAAQNRWDLSIFNHAGRAAAPDPFQVRQRIANRLKEYNVGTKATNTGGTGESQPAEEDKNAASPEVDPAAADPKEESPEDPTVEGAEVESPGAVPNPPTGDQSTTQNRAAQGDITFKVGEQTYNFTPAQAASQLSVLMQFRDETLREARKTFVTNLAAENKILASQIDKLTAYALKLDDEGFDAWKDTWAETPSNSMLAGSHAQGTTNHDGPQSQAVEEAASKLEVARDVVNHLKRGGMTEDQIKGTDSYKVLLAADPNFKL